MRFTVITTLLLELGMNYLNGIYEIVFLTHTSNEKIFKNSLESTRRITLFRDLFQISPLYLNKLINTMVPC